MTTGELEDLISKANSGADVKVKGFREISAAEAVTMDIKELSKKIDDFTIGKELRDSLTQSLKDIKRKPKKIFEDRARNLFLALDQENNLWLLEKDSWFQIKEPGYPDLPQKEV